MSEKVEMCDWAHVGRRGQIEKVDEKAGVDRGKDAVVEDSADEGQHAHEQTEIAGVADFQELRQRQGAGFAEAVVDEPGDGDGEDDRVGEVIPIAEDEAGDEKYLETGHRAGEPGIRLALGVGQEVATGAASAGEEIGNAFDEAVGVKGERENHGQGDEDEDPVDEVHSRRLKSNGLSRPDTYYDIAHLFCRKTLRLRWGQPE